MKSKITFSIFCALIANMIIIQAQNTLVVDNNPNSGAQFTDIQSAIDAANNGDTIYVQQSATNYGIATINKQLNLIGRTALESNYFSQFSEIRLLVGSDNSMIKGFHIINGISTFGVNSSTPTSGNISNITIQECTTSLNLGSDGSQDTYSVDNVVLRGNNLRGINFDTSVGNVSMRNCAFTSLSVANPNSTIISNCVFRSQSTSGNQITNSNPNGTINLTNVIFTGSIGVLRIGGNYSLNHCLLYNQNDPSNPVTVETNSSAVNNVNNCIFGQDPLFVLNGIIPNTPGFAIYADFNVQAGSPAIGSGFNGQDIGYENGFVFKQFGNPKGYPEVKVTNYTGASQSNGTLTFDIEARSH